MIIIFKELQSHVEMIITQNEKTTQRLPFTDIMCFCFSEWVDNILNNTFIILVSEIVYSYS